MKGGQNGDCFELKDAPAPAPWVIEASRQPIAFAQVREDALLDQWVVDQLKSNAAVLMIASGGCTAAMFATMPKISRLHLVDLNPAQIALSRLKLGLLKTADTGERLGILGHASMPVLERRARLEKELQVLHLPCDVLGPLSLLAERGPDRSGRYEIVFEKLKEALEHVSDELTALLQLRDPVEQSRRVEPRTALGQAFDTAFDSVMTLPNLVALFGEAATRNRVEPFCRHFASRTRHVLATLPAADNPYLWQMLRGRFPKEATYPWLSADRPSSMPEVEWTIGTMAEALQRGSEKFDLIHLSNILDWLEPNEARVILDLAWEALSPGGWIFLRQLNSVLDVQSLDDRFVWDTRAGKLLHDCDRSFFYRGLHLARKI